jgi:hypothetical protein
MKFLARLVLPIVLSVFGVALLTIKIEAVRRGQFVFVNLGHQRHIISSSNDPVTFWWESGVLLGVGIILLAIGVYLGFRLIRERFQLSPSEPRLAMPGGLRFLATVCFFFAVFVPFSIVPLDIYLVDEKPATLGEFWRSGMGPLIFLAGIIFLITGYGFVRARTWARYLFSGVWFLCLIKGIVFFQSIGNVLTTFAIAVAVAYYLFWNSNVRNYFGSTRFRSSD